MRKIGFNYRKMTVLCAVVTIMLAQIVTTSVATTSSAPAPSFVDADLSSESQTLDDFVNDLGEFDKKSVELGRKVSLTRAEFDSHERTANDLKRRLSGIQSALGAAIRKLKAAGQWDNLDQIVLTKVSDSKFQDLVRRESFKRSLETASTGLSNNPNEVVRPIDALRNKVQGQAPDSVFERGNSSLASRAVRVAYTPAPPMFAAGLRCSLAWIRHGFSAAFDKNGRPSPKAANAQDCYCLGSQEACQAL